MAGQVKTVADARVGDTVTSYKDPAREALPGYQEAKPMVYCGLFPIEANKYEGLRDALYKLKLNDASLQFEPEVNSAMGYGFRCGFLGLLHTDIVQERLEREYGIDLIVTAPSVRYQCKTIKGQLIDVSNPSDLPDPGYIESILEPYARLEMLTPKDYTGNLIELAQGRRGVFKDM